MFDIYQDHHYHHHHPQHYHYLYCKFKNQQQNTMNNRYDTDYKDMQIAPNTRISKTTDIDIDINQSPDMQICNHQQHIISWSAWKKKTKKPHASKDNAH